MRSQILNLLKQNGDKFLSGEYLADTLKVSRTAIWKHYVIMAIILKVFLEVVIV